MVKDKAKAVLCCVSFAAILSSMSLLWTLDVNLTEDEEEDNTDKEKNMKDLPLTLVLSEAAATPDILDCLLFLLRRGGVLKAETYPLKLPPRSNTNEKHHVVQLICIGFIKDDDVNQNQDHQPQPQPETHSIAQERRELYSFLQHLRIDGKTQEGGHIWAWYDTQSGDDANNSPVPSPTNPSSLLDICLQKKIVTRLFFRHNATERKKLTSTWKLESVWSSISMSDDLSVAACRYMGPEIGLYFEFLNYYTLSLTVPAFFGVLYYVVELCGTSLENDARWWIGLSLVMSLWSSLFLGLWSKRKIDVSHLWVKESVGLYSSTKTEGGLFLTVDKNTKWKRLFSMMVSVVLIAIVIRIDYYLLAWKTSNDIWLNSSTTATTCEAATPSTPTTTPPSTASTLPSLSPPLSTTLSFFMVQYYSLIPTICKALCIAIFDKIFYTVSSLQVTFETHSSSIHKRNSHVLKLCLFHSVSNFLYLYYYAFVEHDISKLQTSLITVLFVSLIIGNFTETVLPWYVENSKS